MGWRNLVFFINVLQGIFRPYRIVYSWTKIFSSFYFWPKNGGCRIDFDG